jgi:hypothetical protein
LFAGFSGTFTGGISLWGQGLIGMNKELTPREIEQISAYLDGELNQKEKARLDARLRVEPKLRRGLHELGETRSMLRSLPRKRAPRNFTLTPVMVGARRKSGFDFFRLTPALSLSSVLATLLLALVLLGDYMTGGLRPVLQVAEAPVQESMALTNVVEQYSYPAPAGDTARIAESGPVDSLSTPTPDTAIKTAPSEEAGAPVGGVPDEALTEQPGVMALAPPPEDVSPTLNPPELTQQSAAQTAAPPGMGVAPQVDSADGFGAGMESAAASEAQEASPTPPGRLTWLVLEIGLASVAVLSTLVFFFLRWKARA